VNLKQIENKIIQKHFLIGVFEEDYVYQVLSTIVRKLDNLTDRETILSIAEDYYLRSRIERDHIDEGLVNITTVTVMNFLYENFDNGRTYGMLHISMDPRNYFRITFDPVDYPDADFLKKVPEEKFAKDYKQLWSVIKSYVDIRESLVDEIKKGLQ